MYEQMYKLEDIKVFFKDEALYEITNERIEELYDLIPNPFSRVNDNDKQWVAFTSQHSEVETVGEAIKDILDYSDIRWKRKKENVINVINEVGNIFIENNISMKPRMPFYIMVLDSKERF